MSAEMQSRRDLHRRRAGEVEAFNGKPTIKYNCTAKMPIYFVFTIPYLSSTTGSTLIMVKSLKVQVFLHD